uniref:hypothetical protein n=1 Tax=Alloprevotella sp. TaxID=1872471 RepID=UPI004025927A
RPGRSQLRAGWAGSRLKISVAFGVVLSDAIYHAVAEGTPVDGTLILFGHYLRYALKWRP